MTATIPTADGGMIDLRERSFGSRLAILAAMDKRSRALTLAFMAEPAGTERKGWLLRLCERRAEQIIVRALELQESPPADQ